INHFDIIRFYVISFDEIFLHTFRQGNDLTCLLIYLPKDLQFLVFDKRPTKVIRLTNNIDGSREGKHIAQYRHCIIDGYRTENDVRLNIANQFSQWEYRLTQSFLIYFDENDIFLDV